MRKLHDHNFQDLACFHFSFHLCKREDHDDNYYTYMVILNEGMNELH